jgi:hypothetical protein
VLVIGVAGGAYATVMDPALPGQVAHAATSDVEWLAGSLSRIGDATRRPAAPMPEPTGTKPVPLITPDPTPETTTIGTVPVARPYPTVPAASPSPSTTIPNTSTPGSYLGWTLPWSGSDRTWVMGTLQLDMQLDTQAETTYPVWQSYYAGWALRWAKAIALIQGLEYPQAVAPSSATLNPIVAWFNQAIALHRQDEQAHPENSAWDNTWIANYTRLDALWAKL